MPRPTIQAAEVAERQPDVKEEAAAEERSCQVKER